MGAVAVDKDGRVAVALSTGGTCGKTPGRVGDTPLLGCGGYCDEAVGAVASTGHGESIAKACLASTVFNHMKQGEHTIHTQKTIIIIIIQKFCRIGVEVQKAAELSCEFLTARTGGTAGAIAVTKDGQVAAAHTTDKMSWAIASNGQLRAGVKWGEEVVENL